MKTLIICKSIHHGNTLKIAREIAKVLNADLKKINEVKKEDFGNYDLLGFGSGIYFFKMHRSLLKFAGKLPVLKNKPVFIFSTSGAKLTYTHEDLKEILQKKETRLVGEFNCRGWDTYNVLKYLGGISQKHPDQKDLDNAKTFANKLISSL